MAAGGIRIVGLGGAGCRVVDRMSHSAADGAQLVLVDSDAQTLDVSTAAAKLQIGAGLTSGLGTGGDMTTGRRAAEEDLPMLRGLFSDMRLVVVVTGLGGGVGSGAGPVVLRAAAEDGAATLCISILPFAFEGEVRQRLARESLRGIRSAADCAIVAPNEYLVSLVGSGTLGGTFDDANGFLCTAVGALRRLLVSADLVSMDFADLANMFGATADSRLAFAEAGDDLAGSNVIGELFSSPLLGPSGLGSDVNRVMISIDAGRAVTLAEVNELCAAARSTVPAGATVSVGVNVDNSRDTGVRLLAVVGSGAPLRDISAPAPAGEQGEPPRKKVVKRPAEGAKSRRKRKFEQAEQQSLLGLEESPRGRFKGVSPTIMDGEDLDVPTFIRRGIDVQR